jgi:hypothetical protein
VSIELGLVWFSNVQVEILSDPSEVVHVASVAIIFNDGLETFGNISRPLLLFTNSKFILTLYQQLNFKFTAHCILRLKLTYGRLYTGVYMRAFIY